jgi:hypothetical protein
MTRRLAGTAELARQAEGVRLMWAIRNEQLGGDREHRFAVELDAVPATFGEVLDAWREDAAFRSLFNDTLANSPFVAFRWETPPVSAACLGRPFEFVLLDSPGLARRPDPRAFAKHFGGEQKAEVAVFPNLGGDAVMIVPCPIAAATAYGHLAAFARDAPAHQRHAFWQSVAVAMGQRLGGEPVWMSTAGAGVSWLHVRLDDRPKYYGFVSYKQFP